VTCSRISKGGYHFQPSTIYEPTPPQDVRYSNPDGTEEGRCIGSGGGGVREKILRIQAYIQAIVDLQPHIHRMSKIKANIKIVEAMWNVRRNPESDRQAEEILRRKRFDIPEVEFVRDEEPAPRARAIANIVRNVRDRELLPTIETGRNEINRSMGFDEDTHVIQFHHRRKDGSINHHETTKISRENLQGELNRRLEEVKKEEELVQCWYNVAYESRYVAYEAVL
jgi:hypothetical protein